MGFLKQKRIVLVLVFLLIAYFILRLYNLTSLPIFTDEAIYIRWAQTGLNDPYYRFLSLTDGKQPLFIWTMYPFLKIFDDPLVAGRMVSVFSGLVTMLGLGTVSFSLFRRKNIALMTMFLYLAYPFAQVMDRMALYDSSVAMYFIWATYLSILLVRLVRWDIAYTLGIVLGAGILTKTSNLLSVYLLPFTLLLFNFKQKNAKKSFFKWLSMCGFAVIISQVMYQILRLSPLPNVISQKNNSFYLPFSEWIQSPFAYIAGNLNGMVPSLVQYLTIPYLVLIIVAVVTIRKDFKEKIMLILFFTLPFVGFAFIASQIFARYFFFMSLPLILLAGWGLGFISDWANRRMNLKNIKSLFLSGFITLIFISYPAYVSVSFANNPINSPIAKADKMQYITSWTSGWGLVDAVRFLEDEAKNGPIYVATEGTFGLYPQGIELYLSENKNIQIKGYYWEITKDFPLEIAEKAKSVPTYFIFYQPCPGGICPRPGDAPFGYPMRQVKEFKTAGTSTRVVIYQVD